MSFSSSLSSFFPLHTFKAAEKTINTNYWGLRRACEILLPKLKPGARVVNLTSSVGWLPKVNFPRAAMKEDIAREDLSVEDLDVIINECKVTLKLSNLHQEGFMDPSYTISKVGICALSR